MDSLSTGNSTDWQERLGKSDPTLRVHLLGIGGAGLTPIAIILHESGLIVSGSDAQTSARTENLQRLGIRVYPSQIAENLSSLPTDQRPDVVLISSAVSTENP